MEGATGLTLSFNFFLSKDGAETQARQGLGQMDRLVALPWVGGGGMGVE